MPIQYWQCCDKNKAISNGAKCRKCGKSRPQYGVLDDKPVIKDSLTTEILNSASLRGAVEQIKKFKEDNPGKPLSHHATDISRPTVFRTQVEGFVIDDPNEHRNSNNRKLSRLPKEKPGELFISTFNKEKD